MPESLHPRNETQEERDIAYNALRKLVKRKLVRHGFERDKYTFLELQNGDMRIGLSRSTQGPRMLQVRSEQVTEDQSVSTLALYVTADQGPVTRHELHADSPAAMRTMSAEEHDARAERSMLNMIANAQAGLDGFPVSAAEATILTGLISDSELVLSNLDVV